MRFQMLAMLAAVGLVATIAYAQVDPDQSTLTDASDSVVKQINFKISQGEPVFLFEDKLLPYCTPKWLDPSSCKDMNFKSFISLDPKSAEVESALATYQVKAQSSYAGVLLCNVTAWAHNLRSQLLGGHSMPTEALVINLYAIKDCQTFKSKQEMIDAINRLKLQDAPL